MRQGTMGEDVVRYNAPTTPVVNRTTSNPITPPTLIVKRDKDGNDMYDNRGAPMYENEPEVSAAYAAYNAIDDQVRSAYKMKSIDVDIYNIHKELVYDHNRSDMSLFYLVQLDPRNPEDMELFNNWKKDPTSSHLVGRSGKMLGRGLFGPSSSYTSSGSTDSSGSLDSMMGGAKGGSLGLSKLLTGTKRARRHTRRRHTKRRGNRVKRSKKTRR